MLIIHTALSQGLRTGLAAAAGAATADLIYASLAALAGLWITSFIGPFETPLQVVGGLVLVAFGVRGLFALRSARETVPRESASRQSRPSDSRTYVSLLGLTLLNPATVIYFTALTVGLPFLGGPAERIAFAFSAGAASLSWQVLLAVIGAGLGRRSGYRLRSATAALGNGVIVIMGLLILLGALSGG